MISIILEKLSDVSINLSAAWLGLIFIQPQFTNVKKLHSVVFAIANCVSLYIMSVLLVFITRR